MKKSFRMKWHVKLPDGRQYEAFGANPEEAAKFVDYMLEPPAPGQCIRLQVRRRCLRNGELPVWNEVALYGECIWTAFPRDFGLSSG